MGVTGVTSLGTHLFGLTCSLSVSDPHLSDCVDRSSNFSASFLSRGLFLLSEILLYSLIFSRTLHFKFWVTFHMCFWSSPHRGFRLRDLLFRCFYRTSSFSECLTFASSLITLGLLSLFAFEKFFLTGVLILPGIILLSQTPYLSSRSPDLLFPMKESYDFISLKLKDVWDSGLDAFMRSSSQLSLIIDRASSSPGLSSSPWSAVIESIDTLEASVWANSRIWRLSSGSGMGYNTFALSIIYSDSFRSFFDSLRVTRAVLIDSSFSAKPLSGMFKSDIR